MIHGLLKREDIHVSPQTVSHILNGRKRIPKVVRKKLNPHNKRYELPIPGQRLQVDVKYVPHHVGGKRVYAYVAIDECTRWRFVHVFDHLDGQNTVVFLDMLKEKIPFPIVCIQTDNGFEFTNKLHPKPNWIHPMESWCERNNVVHRLIPPGVKELNGKVERSHRIDEQYFYWRATDKCLMIFNQQMADWIYRYNHFRPHYGLKFLTPAEKLEERLTSLRQEVLPKELDWMRNQFIMDSPVKVINELGRLKVKLAA
jgi:transposase InsO family protein